MHPETRNPAPETANVDPRELDKFSQAAHRWWDPNSEFRPLHEINPLRLAWIEQAAGGLAGKEVLDVGCGGGILAESMAVRGARVTGIDLAEKPLKVAKLVEEIETSSNEVTQGKMVIDSSLKTLHEIATNIKNVSENVKNLAEFAHEQALKVASISADAVEVAAVSEENAASTEEASAAVEEQTAQTHEIASASTQLAELASQLQATLSKFTLEVSKPEEKPAQKSILAKIRLTK